MIGKRRHHLARSYAVLVVCTIVLLPLRATATLDEARRLATSGNIGHALAHVDELLRSQPKDIAARLLRGVLLSSSGQSSAAIDTFLTVAEDRPDLPEPHNNLAVLYAARGLYEEARGALKRAIDLQPDYDVAHENLGDVYMKLASLAYARAQQINQGNERAADKAAAVEYLLNGQQPDATASASSPPAATRIATSAATSTATSELEHCVRIPSITPASRAIEVARWLSAHGMLATIGRSNSRAPSAAGYRVLLPASGPAQARDRVAQLRAMGVTDVGIIAGNENANAVSLGVFAKRSGAERRQSELANKGVQAQIIEPNTAARYDAASVQARGPFIAAEFAREFADVTFNINDCR